MRWNPIGGTLLLFAGLAGALALYASPGAKPAVAKDGPEPGQLTIIEKDGRPGALCPLEGTKVNAEISGFGARVTLVQTFTNPTNHPIEAIYTFPLPADSAVDRMRMKIGDKIIAGVIKKREEAKKIYETAKQQGKTASLLDQERPNIFTQSVANVMPGANVEIEISYVQILKYSDGEFEFTYPMVVGPRYIGGTVTDANKIKPPLAAKGTRSGSTIDLNITIDAGAKIENIESVLHKVDLKNEGPNKARITLTKKDEIPNKDFILRYQVASSNVKTAFLTHADPKKGGFFTLIMMPPKAPTASQVAPKEMIFVMDQSDSQSGFPIEKSKELTKKLIETMNEQDTFNVVTFNNGTRSLWRQAMPNTRETRSVANAYIDGIEANGGTELLSGVKAALTPPSDPNRVRIVLFNTDGYVGNDFEVLKAVQDFRQQARMFTFGIGNGVNRFLIDAMGYEGRGTSEIVTLNEDADKAVARFTQRLRNPVLTDIDVQIQGGEVTEVLPKYIPDVFSESPVIVKGRYAKAGAGTITINGKVGGEPWSRTLNVTFPEKDETGSAIATVWAREKVDDLMRQNWVAGVSGGKPEDITQAVTQIGLDFSIMTQFTSFVAVEEKIVNQGGKQETIQVPVDLTDGVNYDSVADGEESEKKLGALRRAGAPGAPAHGGFAGGGSASNAVANPAPTVAAKTPSSQPQSTGIAASKSKQATGGRGRADADDRLSLSSMTEAERQQYNVNSKLDKNLLAAKLGKVEVLVWLKDLKPATLDKLAKLGLKLTKTDKELMIAFGTIDAKLLKKLVQFAEVQRVAPMSK